MNHLHIYDRTRKVGTLWVDENGYVQHDTAPARLAADQLGHGKRREDGHELLDAVIKRLDSSASFMSAHHCDKPECHPLHSEQR